MAQFLLKRSGTADKRPDPAQMVIGELDLNYDAITGGIFYKSSGGGVVKVGPAQVSATPPNLTPAGSAGNSLGEFWFNTGDGFLYIWDGSSWTSTAPGVGMASPTVPGVVYGLTGDTDLNVALGKGAGSNITTGTCNVALGPNVAVASATGNCQLAIGYSATANWLTGDSTKAIKPGAGIIDCANSTGFSGQALFSNGSNAVCWGDLPASISPTALTSQGVGAMLVNACDLGGGTCVIGVIPPGKPGQLLTYSCCPTDDGILAGQGYINWCTPNFVSQSAFSPGALVVGCTPSSTGGICTIGTLTAVNNPGVSPGYYTGVTVTSALTGTGALATVNVINAGYFPIFDYVEVTQPGTGYALGETVRFVICGTQVTTCGSVSSLNQSTICRAGYLPVGTNGQVLTVDSTCALGVKWAATSGGSGIPCACITGQGALITGTAASTPVALPVGTAGQVLTVDLACSSGLKWATPAAGGNATPLVAGVVFGCTLATGTGSTALGSGALRVGPVGACNVAVGLNAGCGVNNGACNTIVGALAGDALTDGCNNTVLGFQALSAAATICDATAVGSNAMCVATGAGNTAVGSGAMRSLTTGACNTAVGVAALCSSTGAANNTAVGYQSQFLNNGGTQNTSLGVVALYSNVTGIQNTAIGNNALTNATSSNNTAVGTCASASNVAGANNTSLGNSALRCNTTGSNNASVGINSLFNIIGSSNVGLGANAGCTSTAGDCNVVIGAGIQLPSITGSCQLAVGFGTTCWLTGCSTGAIRPGAGIMDCTGATGTAGQFLMSNGSNAICWGAVPQATATTLGTVYGRNDACFNVAYGQDALCCMATTGPFVVSNVAMGRSAMRCSTSGAQNVAIGLIAMCNTSGASFNVAVGAGSLTSNINGNCNVVLGPNAAPNITASWCNIAIGASSLNATATVFDNVAVGTNSLLQTTGNSNVAIGHTAGSTLTTGGSNVIIGNCVQAPVATGSCQLVIGYSSTCNWLTGCSDKSIRPGAGIMDCAGATGTAGQVLMSNGANAICWGTVSGGSAATPTAAGTVLGVTNATNAGLGCNVLASNTGTNNTALGLNAGCSITTGSCNLALGNNVQVATATGDCQLAIGFSATDNWLTGDSTKAIRPGAGILDCGGSGGAAGQALFSNGANAICWGNTLDLNLFCCQNAATCGSFGGNLIVGSYGDGNISPGPLYPGTPGQILTIDPTNNVNPLKWCTANYLCGACYSKGAIAVGCNQVGGGIQTVTCTGANNPGVAVGYYAEIPLTGGTGSGATANINIINAGYFPFVDSVEIVNPGTGYLLSDNNLRATINGTLISTVFSVTALNTNTIFNYSYLAVGTNGQVLTADSACTNGVKWAAPPASATPLAAGLVLGCTLATGTGSTALGSGALAALPTGTCNVAVGLNAGCAVNTGVLNTLVGSLAGDALTSGGSNTAIGACALSAATTTSNVTAIGACAVCRGTAAGSTAVGACALRDLTTGVCNTAVGWGALRSVTTGSENVAVGYCALLLGTGSRNVALGSDALINSNGCDNVAVGFNTLVNTIGGSGNVAVGTSVFTTGSGSYNIGIGFQAACDVNFPSGNNNIVIGCCAATPTGGVSGSLGTASNRIVMGNSAHTCAQIQIAWTTTSDVRDKALDPAGVPYGLLFVEQLEPIAYRWCDRCTNEVTDEKLRYGFSAQNVRSLEGDEPVIVSDDNPDKLMITDQHLLPVLVNAIKELSEKNKLLEERIAILEDKA